MDNSHRRESQTCTRYNVPLSIEATTAINVVTDRNADIMVRLNGIQDLHHAAMNSIFQDCNKQTFKNMILRKTEKLGKLIERIKRTYNRRVVRQSKSQVRRLQANERRVKRKNDRKYAKQQRIMNRHNE